MVFCFIFHGDFTYGQCLRIFNILLIPRKTNKASHHSTNSITNGLSMKKIIGLILSGICAITLVVVGIRAGYFATTQHEWLIQLLGPINLSSSAPISLLVYFFWWFSYGVIIFLTVILIWKIIALTISGLRKIYGRLQKNNATGHKESYLSYLSSIYKQHRGAIKTQVFKCVHTGFIISLVLFVGLYVELLRIVFYPYYSVINLTYQKFFEPYAIPLGQIGVFILKYINILILSLIGFSIFKFAMSSHGKKCDSVNNQENKE